MWENLKKDKSECGRRGGASSMANLSFVPSQLLRIFIPVERDDEKSCPKGWWRCLGNAVREARDTHGVHVDQVLPCRSWEKMNPALWLAPGPRQRVCWRRTGWAVHMLPGAICPAGAYVSPQGTWLCSQPRAAVFLHLLQPSSALLCCWQLSSGSADWTQIKWQPWDFKEKGKLFHFRNEKRNVCYVISLYAPWNGFICMLISYWK